MQESLLKHICCPICKSDLSLEKGEVDEGEILSGKLICGKSECGRTFPISRGVPRLLPDQLSSDKEHTAENFGKSWKMWSEVFDERYREQFYQWLTPLKAEDFKGRFVLDCGCGKGRHARVVAQAECKEFIGVDLSEAVDVAFANTHEYKNIHIVQADIFNLPLKKNFDLAYSIGVLHHTPDPGASFQAMSEQVKPGGTSACWVYGRENNAWIVYVVTPIRRIITRYLPSLVVKGISWLLTVVMFMAIHLLYRPLRALGINLFYADYMFYLRDLGFGESHHIVYDHLIAPTAFYLRKGEVEDWQKKAGLEDCTLEWVRSMSWAAVGKRANQQKD